MKHNYAKKPFVGSLTFFRHVCSCILLAGICLSPTYAQSSESESKSEQLYQIEVIMFEHLDKSGLQEAWPLEPGKPNVYNVKSLTELDSRPQESAELNTEQLNSSEFNEHSENNDNSEPVAESAFQIYEAKELQLDDAKARLKAKGHYRIIAHKAWRQPIQNKAEAQPIHFTAGKTYAQQASSYSVNNYNVDEYGYKDENEEANNASALLEVDGTIKFTRSRYLHVDTDLVFTKPMRVLTPASGASSAVKLTNVRNRSNWERESNARLQPFRLKQFVRIRKNEVQYLDHPMYGMLVTVSSVDN